MIFMVRPLSLAICHFLVTTYIGLGDRCHDSYEMNLRGSDFDECGCHAYPVEQSFVAPHLEVVKIECRKVYVRIRKNLNILSTFGVDYKKKKSTSMKNVLTHIGSYLCHSSSFV